MNTLPDDGPSGQTLRGVAASGGVAIGPAFQFHRTDLRFDRRQVKDSGVEWKRFQNAVETARAQLAEMALQAEQDLGRDAAAIFQAQILMLEDPELLTRVRLALEEQGVNAEAALSDASGLYVHMLEAVHSEYLRARAADVRDVTTRLLCILLGISPCPDSIPPVPSVILAHHLMPSDILSLDRSRVLGLCTAEGGATSHVALLARALGLPAVVGMGPGVLQIPSGTMVVLDGGAGLLLVEPDPQTLGLYRARAGRRAGASRRPAAPADGPAVTRDGHRVLVAANVGTLEEARLAREVGADGIGLLRTEFLYLGRPTLPDEEEQYHSYRAILELFGDHPVVLRTLDVGGDKRLPGLELPSERNPALGLRAIRLSLARPEMFRPQLRAALRAGVGHNLKIMFPMVTTVAELRAARTFLEECRAELQAEGHPVADVAVGMMVEVPSAALMADRLAEEVDFFSIGTNDLSQYVMAADRTHAAVAPLADALHPAVLRLVRDVIAAAHARGKWVSLCGEVAGDPLAIPILLGLGLDELSMNPTAIPQAKRVIRSLTREEADQIARAALQQESAEAVRGLFLISK
ncbi:MAG: phosphoenolpyruvate--protein phosphotransferase [Anaerolineae bacterium]